eukprot:12106389-Alexandrium_andersonii.AAC.1
MCQSSTVGSPPGLPSASWGHCFGSHQHPVSTVFGSMARTFWRPTTVRPLVYGPKLVEAHRWIPDERLHE